MNLMSVFTPKSEVAVLYNNWTLRQVMEKMEKHRYTSLPMLDTQNRYVGTVTEGDLLWFYKNQGLCSIYDAEKISIRDVPLHVCGHAVSVNTGEDALLDALLCANFVPVEDDRGYFIGIVTRKRMMEAFLKRKEASA